MDYSRHISRRLHEEHEATLALWGRLEQTLAMRGSRPPTDEDLRLMRDCAAQIDDEVTRHFAFEEKDLFPLLAASGEGDIADLLREEHAAIRDAAQRFGALAQPGGDAQAKWPELRTLALELVERLMSHVQKEEMSLLPSLEDLLDEETDQALAGSYV
jgi:hemerythrin-like domain-containing protein